MVAPRHIASVPKNARERIDVSIRDLSSGRGVDLRVYATHGSKSVSTFKGVALRPEQLRPIIEALEAAERAVKAEGLLPARRGGAA